MRLLQSGLPGVRQPKQPHRTFLAQLCGLLLLLPGHATFRHLRRDSSYDARPFARWDARACDFVSRKQAALTRVIPPAQAQALVIDASFVPTSGQQTSGLDRCWHGRHGRSEQGRDISALAWRDSTAHCADARSVAQTPPTSTAPGPASTRLDVSLDPWTRVVSAHARRNRRYVIPDGSDSTQQCLRGGRALGRHQSGTRRLEATLRARSPGAKRRGPGRPKPSDGTGHWEDRRRFAPRKTAENHLVRSHPVRNHVQCQWHLRVVLVVDTTPNRRAVRLSTDVAVEALTLSRYDTARVHIALLCRDAKQCTGLCDCQARAQAQRDLHCKARLTAVTLAKRAARQQNGGVGASFSLARLKRRACNQPLIDRICDQFAKGHS